MRPWYAGPGPGPGPEACWSWSWSWSWCWCWQLFPWTQALCTVILVGGGRKASPGCDGRLSGLSACCRYLAAVVLGTETCISEQPVFWFSVRVYLVGTRAATAGVSSSSSKPNSEQQEQPGPHDARCNHGWLVDQTGAEAGRCARRSLVRECDRHGPLLDHSRTRGRRGVCLARCSHAGPSQTSGLRQLLVLLLLLLTAVGVAQLSLGVHALVTGLCTSCPLLYLCVCVWGTRRQSACGFSVDCIGVWPATGLLLGVAGPLGRRDLRAGRG
jgi:hypothetical protein